MVFSKSIDQLTREDVVALVANGVSESRTLDYKDQLPTWNDKARHDLLADFSAFANTAGGWILYGVSEKRDDGGTQTGVPEAAQGLAGVTLDQEILRIHQILDAGLDPRIPGVQLRAIDGFPNGPVLVAHIPRSWLRPHMLTNRSSPFYGRNSRGCYPLDVQEVRTVVLGTADAGEKLRRFRQDRLAAILSGEAADLLPGLPRLVLHAVPLDALGEPGSRPQLDVRRLEPMPLPLGGAAYEYRFNYHGRFGYAVGKDAAGHTRIKRYVQVFRAGVIEALDCVGLGRDTGRNLPGLSLEQDIIRTLADHLKALPAWGVAPPAVVMLSLVGASGWRLASDPSPWPDQWVPFEVDLIALPEVLVENFSQDAATVLRPALDVLWQAAGRPQSPYYNDDGTHR